eukprot:3248222-Rhodomonas_salina.8
MKVVLAEPFRPVDLVMAGNAGGGMDAMVQAAAADVKALRGCCKDSDNVLEKINAEHEKLAAKGEGHEMSVGSWEWKSTPSLKARACVFFQTAVSRRIDVMCACR